MDNLSDSDSDQYLSDDDIPATHEELTSPQRWLTSPSSSFIGSPRSPVSLDSELQARIAQADRQLASSSANSTAQALLAQARCELEVCSTLLPDAEQCYLVLISVALCCPVLISATCC